MNFTTVLRWLLALLSAPFGFYLALYIGIFADGFVAGFCPPELVISGLCTTAIVFAGQETQLSYSARRSQPSSSFCFPRCSLRKNVLRWR